MLGDLVDRRRRAVGRPPGLHRSTVTRLVRHPRPPAEKTLRLLAPWLEVPYEDLAQLVGETREQVCARRLTTQRMAVYDAESGKVLNLVLHEAARRSRRLKPSDTRVILRRRRTLREKRDAGIKAASPSYERSDHVKDRLRSQQQQLSAMLGRLWKIVDPDTRLRTYTHPNRAMKVGRDGFVKRGGIRGGNTTESRLPDDANALRSLALDVVAAKESKPKGATFVAITRSLGAAYAWRTYRDRYGNETICPMASKVYRLGLAIRAYAGARPRHRLAAARLAARY